MLEKLNDSDVPFDWMFVMFGITLVATGLCTGAPHSRLLVWGASTEAKVLELNPSLKEVPLEPEPSDTKRQKLPGGKQAQKDGRDGRYARLRFPLVHPGAAEDEAADRQRSLPDGPLDSGDLELERKIKDGKYETELKVPPGAVKSFEELRVSGESVDIVYRPSDPDYLLRRKDLHRLATASGLTIGAGILFFGLAWLIRRRDDS